MDQSIVKRLIDNDPSLIKISLHRINEKDTRALADALKQNTKLKVLSLHDSPMLFDSVRAIADAIIQNKKLESIFIHNGQFGDEGAIVLADALKHNNTVKLISLKHNRIKNKGAIAFADMLLKNNALAAVILDGNSIGDDGAKALANALTHNKTLLTLGLRANLIDLPGGRALARIAALKGNDMIDVAGNRYNFTNDMVEEEKTKIKHDNARRAEWTFLLMGVQQRKGTLEMEQTDEVMLAIFTKTPNDVFVILAKKQWDSRDDEDLWLFDPAERDAQGAPAAAAPKRSRTTNACLGCLIGTPVFHEQHDTSRRFCSAYCQLIHYYQLPDLRGMTPAQIRINMY